MKTKNIDLINQKIYYEELSNGLKVYLVKDDRFDSYVVSYFTNYGALDLSFYYQNELKETNPGIAHFLEHKVFETKDETSIFEFFDKSGTISNAFTSYVMTNYWISGNKNYANNLNKILSFVNSPNITEKNVEKEKGIISEELKMYEDTVDWKIDFEISKMVFKNSNFRHDIGGRVEDIMKITKEELELCYDVFYNPVNMSLVICGNIDIEKTREIIKKHKLLNAKKKGELPIKKEVPEPFEVVEKEKNIEIKNISPRINFVIKLEESEFDYENQIKYAMIVDSLFGSCSVFREKWENKLFKTLYGVSYYVDRRILLSFYSITDKPDELVKAIKEEFQKEISQKSFNLAKKNYVLKTLNSYSTNKGLNLSIAFMLNQYGKIIDLKEVIDSISLSDVEELRKSIDLENSSLLKINFPK